MTMAAKAGSDEERAPQWPAVTTVLGDGDAALAATMAMGTGDDDGRGAMMSADEAALAALGYRQEFRREFGPWSTFAVSFAVMGLLPSIASTMWYGIGYGA